MSSYDFRADIGKTVFTNDHREVRIIGYNPNVGGPRQLIIQHNDGRPGTRSIFSHSVGGEIHNLRPPYLTPPFAKEIAAAEEKATRHDFRQNIGEIVMTHGNHPIKIIDCNEDAAPNNRLIIQYVVSGIASARNIYGEFPTDPNFALAPPTKYHKTNVRLWRGTNNELFVIEERFWNVTAPKDSARWCSDPIELSFIIKPGASS